MTLGICNIRIEMLGVKDAQDNFSIFVNPNFAKELQQHRIYSPTHVDTNPIDNIENLFYLSMASDME